MNDHSPSHTPAESEDADIDASRKSKRRKIAAEDRKRAVRACDGCRRVKEKCEGGTPCRRCTHFRRRCEFNAPVTVPDQEARPGSRRSEHSASYVNELIDRSTHMERILRYKYKYAGLDTASLKKTAETLNNEPNHASDLSDHDDGDDPHKEDIDIRAVDGNITHYSGEFSYWNFSQRIKRHVEDWMGGTTPEVAEPERVSDFWRVERLFSGSNSLSKALSCLPPRDIGDFLVQVFFKHAESNFFYVERSWLEEVIHLLYTHPGKLTAKDVPKVGIALATFAVGTQYAYLESFDHSNKPSSVSSFTEDDVGTMFFEQAAKLLPEVIQVASLESVQACLLLGLYTLPIDASGLAYIYFNLAMKLAMQNGMHRRYAGDAFSPVIIETRNRVWWTSYVNEKKIGVFHGRPDSVRRSRVYTNLPKDRADMHQSGSTSNIPHMLASIHLLFTLEDILDEMEFLQKCEKSELQGILSRLINTKDSLADWFKDLPPEVCGDARVPGTSEPRPSMHIRLEYCLVRMFLGRPFLLSRQPDGSTPTSLPDKSMKPPLSNDTGASETSKRPSKRAILVEDCVQAAKEAIAICRLLRDSGAGLARASYIEYSSCRAALLVLIAYCIYNQTNRFRESLQSGLSMIREMSSAGDSAKAEVSLIEALERALARLQFFGGSSQMAKDTEASHRPSMSGYDRFKNWQLMIKGGPSVKSTTNHNPVDSTSYRSAPSHPLVEPQVSQPWSVDSVSDAGIAGFTIPGSAGDTSGLGPLHSAAESAFFGLDSMLMPSDGPVHPEGQVLHDFLAIPDYEFNFGVDSDGGHYDSRIFGHGHGYGTGSSHPGQSW